MPTRRKSHRSRKTTGKSTAASPRATESSGTFQRATQQDVAAIVELLHECYPDADCELDWNNPFELLIATILSAQSTDKRVNEVGRDLFRKYPDVRAFAAASPEELEQDIKSTGFYRQKTKNILGTAHLLIDEFGGEVPQNLEDLITLPGVARKTANVVLGTAFEKAVGVVVDTHVKRLAYRLGMTAEEDPVKVERALMDALPVSEWIFVAHALIWHGRRVCAARKPACDSCALEPHCPRNGVG